MDTSMLIQNQILATKFYIPVPVSPLISRSRLMALLVESLKYPFTLVSAPAGFGKTILLSTWVQSLPPNHPSVAWISLDADDNEPRPFWTYVLTALNMQQPERFTPLLKQWQSPQPPPLKYILTELINVVVEGTDHFLLILDDYQIITEQQVHKALAYLIEHLPDQLHIIVATRADPPLPFSVLRAHKQILEVRTNQMRCTTEETRAFFYEMMSINLSDEIIQQITVRTEGWLVGLRLLGLSLSERADPLTLLQEISGDQRYILDFLTQEVLQQQPQEIQTFLLCTSILEHLSASLCDTVMEKQDSQKMLVWLESANLFVSPLDSKQQWYRYHPLFAEVLRYRLEQRHADLVPLLHHRASLWYAEHNQTTQAILHALSAHQWEWAADLIERKSLLLLSHVWGASHHTLTLLQQWLSQLPEEVVYSRPLLCLDSADLLFQVAPFSILHGWLDVAEAALNTATPVRAHGAMLTPQMQQDHANLLPAALQTRAILRCFEGDGPTALAICEQAFTLLSVDNSILRSLNLLVQAVILYVSMNDATLAVHIALQAFSLAQSAGLTALALNASGIAGMFMMGTGQLHEIQRLTQQAIFLGGSVLPEVGYPSASQAEMLREWNKLDSARLLAEEAVSLYRQTEAMASLTYLLYPYGVLLRVYLSCQDYNAAYATLQEFEHISMQINQPISTSMRSYFTTVDQVRLWLACGELDHATRWAKELDLRERRGTPFDHEREEVAYIRVLLANKQPNLALQRLEPVLQNAIAGKRWGHVIEMHILQALAHQMCQEERQALNALSEAVRLGEPEGYIRSFVDEGAPMGALLYQLRKRERKYGPTPYLDTLLTAFQQESKAHEQTEEPNNVYQLPEPLSKREREVLQLLVHGASNQEIAQELSIAVDTVKRHVSHIFSRLGVKNRVQAVRQAQELGLLSEED